MKKESPTTYRFGSLSEFAEWTKGVVRDPNATDGAPKKWFDSEETAARAATDRVSAEASRFRETRRSFATADLPEETAKEIGASRMDARHAHLDDILKE